MTLIIYNSTKVNPYTKLMGGYKEVDQLNADFKKAQKNWLKMEKRVEKQKMRYHRVCHELAQNETRAKQEWSFFVVFCPRS